MFTEEIADIMAIEGVEYTILHKLSITDFEDDVLRDLVKQFKKLHIEVEYRVKALIPDDHEFQTY